MNKLIEALVHTSTPSDEKTTDFSAIEDALRQCKDRFIEERVNGFTTDSGYHAPVPREQAEARWLKAEPKFREVLLRNHNDPETVRRLGFKRAGQLPKSADFYDSDYREKKKNFPGADTIGMKDEFPAMDPDEYERGWHDTPYERGMRAEPSLRRGESKAGKIVNKLIG